MSTPTPVLCDCGAQLGEPHEAGCPSGGATNCPYCFVAKGTPHRDGCPSIAMRRATVTPDVVAEITAARGSVYGPFINNAIVGQAIRNSMRCPNWKDLPIDVREGLDYIAGKISRIVTGDPEYLDNWDDIGGFAKIVADRIRNTKKEKTK